MHKGPQQLERLEGSVQRTSRFRFGVRRARCFQRVRVRKLRSPKLPITQNLQHARQEGQVSCGVDVDPKP